MAGNQQPKRTSLAKRWCFTVNNYNDEDCQRIPEDLEKAGTVYCIVAREIGSQCGTPHLQGFVHFNKRYRLSTLKTLISSRAHFEVARGDDMSNKVYCCKEGMRTVVYEAGVPMPATTHKGGSTKVYTAGLRVARRLSRGATIDNILDQESPTKAQAYMRYHRSIDKVASAMKATIAVANARDENLQLHPKIWQRDLILQCRQPPDSRKITWLYEEIGGIGKTLMSKFFVANMGAIRFENAKSADIKFANEGQRIALFDLSRSQQDHFNYEVLENIKNGIMFSSKYESSMKVYPPPHVIVFANWPPQEGKLSQDRWDIRFIDVEDNIKTEETFADMMKKDETEESIHIEDSDTSDNGN